LTKNINKLVRKRIKLIVWLLGILFISYFTIPLALALFPDKMTQPTFLGGASFLWVYTFWQIPLTWVMGGIYWYKAKGLDRKMHEVLQEEMV